MTHRAATALLLRTLIALFGLSGSAAWAVDFDHLGLDEGLSQSTVYAIAQDRQGFLWFATQDGLNRYDGYEMRVYRAVPDNPLSLSDGHVNGISADANGDLWLSTKSGGLNRFDIADEVFTRYQHLPDDGNSLASNRLSSVLSTKDEVWVGTQNHGINRLTVASGQVVRSERIRDYERYCGNRVTSLALTRGGQLLVGSGDNGLCTIDTQQMQAAPLDASDRGGPGQNIVNDVAAHQDGSIWVATARGLNVIDTSGVTRPFEVQTVEGESLDQRYIRKLLIERDGDVWIGTLTGVFHYQPKQQRLSHFEHSPLDLESLSDNNVFSLFEDDAGLVWIGTGHTGVNKYNPFRNYFENFSTSSNRAYSLSHPVVHSILPTGDNHLWVGTENGLNRIELQSGRVRQYFANPTTEAQPGTDVIRGLALQQGRLWIGSAEGLFYLDTAQKSPQIRAYSEEFNREQLRYTQILTLRLFDQRHLWIGTNGRGAFKLDTATGEAVQFQARGQSSAGLSDSQVYSILEDREGRIWFGTLGGLDRLDPDGSWHHFQHRNDDVHSLSDNGVGFLYQSQDGTIWVGTDYGLNRYRPETQDFMRLTTTDGLPNSFVYGIQEDHQGNLWISTNRGLTRLDPRQKTFKNFDVNDGLQSNEFNSGAAARDDEGYLYFGGVNGVSRFQPTEVKLNQHIPPVVLTQLSILGNLQPEALARDGLELSYQQNYFSFEVAALDFVVPSQNQYAYKLEGFNDEWVYNGHRRLITYTNLDGGDYLLRVKASNSDGIWNNQGLSLPIHISSPPWRTPWAYAIYTALGLGALLLIVHAGARRESRQQTLRLRSATQGLLASLDLGEVLTNTLSHMNSLIRYDHAAVYLLKDEHWQRMAEKGRDDKKFPEKHCAPLEQRVINQLERSPIQMSVRNLLSNDERRGYRNERLLRAQLLAVPMFNQAELFGVIFLYNLDGQIFTQREIEMAETFTDQASIAVVNAHLFSEVNRLAGTDELTKLANRRHFFELAEREFARAQRGHHLLSLIMMDIDHFKRINDNFGHAAGDKVLKQVANRSLAALRQADVMARFGGEEFIILLPDETASGAYQVAQRLQAEVAKITTEHEGKVLTDVTASFGVSQYDSSMERLGNLIEAADKALYHAKATGRNRIIIAGKSAQE